MSGLWHPSGERLSALLDGEITDWDRARVLAHVERCPDCAGAIAAEEQVKRALGALRAVPMPTPDLLQRALLALGDPSAPAAGRPTTPRIPVPPRIPVTPRHRAAPAPAVGAVRTASETAPRVPVTSRRPRAPRVGGRPGTGPRRRSAPVRRRAVTASVLSVAALGIAFASVLPATAARTRSVATVAVSVLSGTQQTTTDAGGAERQLGRPGPGSLSTAARILFSTLDPLSAASSTGLPRTTVSAGSPAESSTPTPVTAGGNETLPGSGAFATTATTSASATASTTAVNGGPTFATAGPGEAGVPTGTAEPTSPFQPPGTPTASPTATDSPDPTASPDPSDTPVPAPLMPTASPDPTGSPTPSPVPPSSTGAPTLIPTASAPGEPTPDPTPDPTATPSGTGTPSVGPDPSATPDPATTQASATDHPSATASGTPSPTATPSVPPGLTGGTGSAP